MPSDSPDHFLFKSYGQSGQASIPPQGFRYLDTGALDLL
jgi:hypothetical protein